MHIVAVHPSYKKPASTEKQRRKDFDIRDVRDKKPCNPSDPMHTNNCCDRKPRQESKLYSETEKEMNGPCRLWNNGNCSFSDSCKFLHVEICHFQNNKCRYGSYCRYFHFQSQQQENAFLGRRNQSQHFFQQEEGMQRRR